MKHYEIVRNEQRSEVARRRRARAATMRLAFILALACATICIATSTAVDDGEPEKQVELLSLDISATAPPLEKEAMLVTESTDDHYILYDIPLSKELQNYTQDVCEEYGVSYPLALAVMNRESRYQADAVSKTSDYGIMQINQGNHEWLEEELGITDWLDPEQNILAGVYVLSQFSEYEDPHQILMSYNCGPTGAKRLWADGVYSTAYSRAVVEVLDGLEVMSIE